MMIPLDSDRPLSRPKLITPILVMLNLAVFLAGQTMSVGGGQSAQVEAATQWAMLHPGPSFQWWTLITYTFLHAGWLHLLGNMVILWVFGPNVEDKFGRIWFTLFYFAGGAAAGGLHVLFEKSPVVGASGAIAAVTGAFLVLFPRTHIKVFILFVTIGVYNVPAWAFVIMAVVWDLVLQGMARGDRIAHLAHLGGYSFGFLIAMGLLFTKLISREPYDLFSQAKQAKRRRDFAEATRLRTESDRQRAEQAQKVFEASGSLLADRAAVSKALGELRLDDAAKTYAHMVSANTAAPPQFLVMPRRQQIELAGSLFASGQHADAIGAFERFANAYPQDPESPRVRLMVGLIAVRHLRDKARAQLALGAIDVTPTDPELAALLEELKREAV